MSSIKQASEKQRWSCDRALILLKDRHVSYIRIYRNMARGKLRLKLYGIPAWAAQDLFAEGWDVKRNPAGRQSATKYF